MDKQSKQIVDTCTSLEKQIAKIFGTGKHTNDPLQTFTISASKKEIEVLGITEVKQIAKKAARQAILIAFQKKVRSYVKPDHINGGLMCCGVIMARHRKSIFYCHQCGKERDFS